jgi:hypothetical protein
MYGIMWAIIRTCDIPLKGVHVRTPSKLLLHNTYMYIESRHTVALLY